MAKSRYLQLDVGVGSLESPFSYGLIFLVKFKIVGLTPLSGKMELERDLGPTLSLPGGGCFRG